MFQISSIPTLVLLVINYLAYMSPNVPTSLSMIVSVRLCSTASDMSASRDSTWHDEDQHSKL